MRYTIVQYYKVLQHKCRYLVSSSSTAKQVYVHGILYFIHKTGIVILCPVLQPQNRYSHFCPVLNCKTDIVISCTVLQLQNRYRYFCVQHYNCKTGMVIFVSSTTTAKQVWLFLCPVLQPQNMYSYMVYNTTAANISYLVSRTTTVKSGITTAPCAPCS